MAANYINDTELERILNACSSDEEESNKISDYEKDDRPNVGLMDFSGNATYIPFASEDDSTSSLEEYRPKRKRSDSRNSSSTNYENINRKSHTGTGTRPTNKQVETFRHISQPSTSGFGAGEAYVRMPDPERNENVADTSLLISEHPFIVPVPETRGFSGCDGHRPRWTSKPKLTTSRTAERNDVHILQSTLGEAKKAETPIECFSLFMNDDIIKIVLEHTNAEICRRQVNYNKSNTTISETCIEELRAILGLLILSAALKDNHLSTKEMFDSNLCGSAYKATCSKVRFEFLLDCLRFDNKDTRNERKNDPFIYIREIWDIFIENCTKHYYPGSYLTIDEQLLAFRGRCTFRTYIPNKPSKYRYGIKIIMMCDAGTKYMLNAMPYLGKGTETGGKLEFYVKELIKSCHATNRNISGRNVTTNKWFTSVQLATDLLKSPYNLTMVGMLRKNKKEIPPEMLDVKGREVGSSLFCFDEEKTMVSFMPKSKKIELFLSTKFMHESAEISEQNKKPEIINCYNATKSGVDIFDHMCMNMSTSRKTGRWPMCVFYGMMNAAVINSYVVHCHNMLHKKEKHLARRQFMMELYKDMIKPWLQVRSTIPTLQRPLRATIRNILGLSDVPERDARVPQKRTVCSICPSRLRRMTTTYCGHCKRAICTEHRALCCVICDRESELIWLSHIQTI